MSNPNCAFQVQVTLRNTSFYFQDGISSIIESLKEKINGNLNSELIHTKWKNELIANLLSISAESYNLVVVVFKFNTMKVPVRNILYYVPRQWEEAIPSILLPKFHVFFEINRAYHLGQSYKLATGINLKSNIIR